jgi:hypothetical protein
MSANIEQIYINNPASTIEDTDLIYLGRSPYGSGNDMAALASTVKAYASSGNTGLFVPALSFGGDAVGMTGTFTGFFVKNGVQVDIIITIALTNKGSSVGDAEVGNFPYIVNTTAGAQKWIPMYLQNCAATGATYTSFAAHTISGDTSAALYNFPQNNLTAIQLDNTNFNNNSIIILTGTYWTNP